MISGNEPINSIPDLNNHFSDWYGLTKREYFAAIAMQGIYSSVREEFEDMHRIIAEASVKAADSLIEQLNK